MENAGAIFYADGVFTGRSVSTGLIAHETAHQWFGDAVTPGSWGHLWLSEGFASYFEQLWVEKSQGVGAFRAGMQQLRREIIQSDVTFSRPVIDTLQTNLIRLLNTNSYQKGAWTLHMLRSMLGDTVFFRGVREYYRQHRHSSATTDDLCGAFERVSMKSLRWFFDQWLRRPGIPEVSANWSFSRRIGSLKLEVSQSEKALPYAFPLSVEIAISQQRSYVFVVDIPARRNSTVHIPIPPNMEPIRVVLDPGVELLASIKYTLRQ
jgi:aminopeptidase N